MTKRLYKYLSEDVIYSENVKIKNPIPIDDTPMIITFSLGNSSLGSNIIPITSLTYNNVDEFLINDTGITPLIDSPLWILNLPTEVIL